MARDLSLSRSVCSCGSCRQAGSLPPLGRGALLQRFALTGPVGGPPPPRDDADLTSGPGGAEASYGEMWPAYTALAAGLARAGADLILCEGLGSVAEVQAAAEAAAAGAAGLPIFVSVRLQEDWARYGGCLASGESVGQAFRAVRHVHGLDTFLFNGCSAESVVQAVPSLHRANARHRPSRFRRALSHI